MTRIGFTVHGYRPDPTLGPCVKCGGQRMRCEEHMDEIECFGRCRYEGTMMPVETPAPDNKGTPS